MADHGNKRATIDPGILILSAPSGAGKTSLARALVADRTDAGIVVSHTTREQRPGETNGKDYFFVSRPRFEEMISGNRFIEYATVFDHFYGTSIEAIEELILDGKHAILDIDWQGARNVRKLYPASVSAFIMPPSIEALEQRLKNRKKETTRKP